MKNLSTFIFESTTPKVGITHDFSKIDENGGGHTSHQEITKGGHKIKSQFKQNNRTEAMTHSGTINGKKFKWSTTPDFYEEGPSRKDKLISGEHTPDEHKAVLSHIKKTSRAIDTHFMNM